MDWLLRCWSYTYCRDKFEQALTILMTLREQGAAGHCKGWGAEMLTLFTHTSPHCDGFKISHRCLCCLVEKLFFPTSGLLPLLPFCFLAQNRVKKKKKPPFAVIVTFTAAIVGERWSLLFPVSPGYHFPLKLSRAPTLSWGVNKQIKQSCSEYTHTHICSKGSG